MAPDEPDYFFYDGGCGLCHRAVRFVIAHDKEGTAFRFAPILGERFQELVPKETQARLPDSMVVLTAQGQLLLRSEAIRHILLRLGGMWRVPGVLMRLVPLRLRDAAYDFMARVRHRFFAKPKDACPLVPKELRGRFSS